MGAGHDGSAEGAGRLLKGRLGGGLRRAAAALLRGWLRAYHRLTIVGRENLPAGGRSFVLVANHASHLDALCLLSALPPGALHRAFPAAAKDYFFVSAPLALLAGVFNALPFDRRLNPRESLERCARLLDGRGNVLILFPEGSRSPTGEVGEFRPGVGFLLAGRATPVVPCYLEGTHAAWPKGAYLPRPRRVRLVIGRPRTYAHLLPDKGSAVHLCSDLRDAVLALAGPRAAQRTRERALCPGV
jgi:1-acyl-sn-glycerol-3-phosphate acyltransferase